MTTLPSEVDVAVIGAGSAGIAAARRLAASGRISLLVLEARVVQGKSVWQYALVQMTGEPVAVELDGKEAWKQEAAEPPAVRASYVNGWIETKKGEK